MSFVSSFLGLEGAAFTEEKCPHGGDGTCIDFLEGLPFVSWKTAADRYHGCHNWH